MTPRRVLSPRDAAQLFDRAVAEHALAVLSLQADGGWQTLKSRFLERDPRGRFIVLDYHSENGTELPPLAPGQCIGMSFRQRSHKLLFATVVEARGHYLLPNQARLPAVRYRWPETVTELQRRAYFRTPVPDDLKLAVRLWPGGLHTHAEAQSGALPTVLGELADLSCGGALVRLQDPAATPGPDDQTLGVELQLPDGRPPILLEARARGERQDASNGQGLALQFLGLELSPDGNVTLQRLANSVQRLHRLGAALTGPSGGAHFPR
ncbi:MAG: PilZ domain-containing protein [Planctomycetota bacterium]